ncbi:hypothetical protein [Massilia oculi]|jgi:hypothetical protein|uniref:hypothetical protein n=2 Tax=Massilia TaxID=149698 RepID=UPI0004E39D78|nr:hypothetical protein [Massilia oculi]KFC73285.1 hypothetical protein FG94_01564 [Massilia sp. LC238]
MANGRNDAVQMDEDKHREECGNIIADIAANLVAAGDMGRKDAIKEGVKWIRSSRDAAGDVTGTLDTELVYPKPSKQAPSDQVYKIKQELMDEAQEAAEDL